MSEAGVSETSMTTAAAGAIRLPAGRAGLRDAVAMEWIKLRSLRSTWWTLAVTVAGLIGLAILVLAHIPGSWAHMSRADRAAFDPTNLGFIGVALAQLALAVLGVLAITGEYSSGMIRSTLAAVPRRGLALAAKAGVVGVVALVTGEVGAFAAFWAGQAMLHAPAPHATLGQPGVARAVVLAGVYLALIALIGLAIGVIVRRSADKLAACPPARLPVPASKVFTASPSHTVAVRTMPAAVAAA